MQYAIHFISDASALFVTLLSSGGYWVLGVVLLLEALPVIGSFIPGHILIIIAGFLSNLGVLNFEIVLITAIIATVLGDVAGFFLGRRYGYDALRVIGKYFFINSSQALTAREKFWS